MTVRLEVRVHPGARRTALRGWHDDGTLRVDVAAPPEGGRANAALAELIARALDVRRRDVSVERGAASRRKVVAIDAIEAAELRRRLEAALAAERADA